MLVDEFQDTNRLQCELIDLVAGGELFFVGDEFQSIYRFRHADVSVYRAQRAEAGQGLIALRRNHRSRPHVIDVVNEVFSRDFGDRYTPLVAEARHEGDPPAGGRVELLLTDKAGFREAGESWRAAEARALAARIAELVDDGEARPGQIVLLFEAGTDAAQYEAALRDHHLRTVRTTGRGYYATQQVSDLLAYLRLLRNRYDDVALLTVLASPLVGMSNDGLLRVRRAAVKRPIFTAFERDEPAPGLSPEDRRLSLAFAQRFARLVKRSGEVSLERLCELIVAEHDYDLACLAMADGDRRYANLRKLARLAAEFEAVRGPDLEGFIRFCDEQATLAAREGEAAIAEEGRDAIVLMTVHAAKGLEFDVVVLADQGRERAARSLPDVLVSSDGRVALRAPDANGVLRPAIGYTAAAKAEREGEREEGRRLQYVAMTRARQHLIVSGALLARRADVDRRGVPAARDRARRRRRHRPRRGPPDRAGHAPRGARRRRERRSQGRGGSGRPWPRGGGAARALHGRRPRGGAAPAAGRDPAGGAGAGAAPLLQRPRALRPVRLPVLRPAGAGAARAGHPPGAGRGARAARGGRRGAPRARTARRALARPLSECHRGRRGADRRVRRRVVGLRASRSASTASSTPGPRCRSRSRSAASSSAAGSTSSGGRPTGRPSSSTSRRTGSTSASRRR